MEALQEVKRACLSRQQVSKESKFRLITRVLYVLYDIYIHLYDFYL